MQKDNRASNARYLGEFIAGIIQRIPEDQYRPMPPLFVEEPEQEPEKKRKNDPHQWRGQMIGPIVEYIASEPSDIKIRFTQEPEQEPDPEELPDQDWASQPTEYDPS
jgi:hypothetical protein